MIKKVQSLMVSAQKIQKIWQYRGQEKNISDELLFAASGSPLLARLLVNRNLDTAEKIQEFMDMEDYKPTSGWELPDMKEGLDRVLQALDSGEHILIYGDFDVDGITGTSVLYQAFKHLDANVSFYIPDRTTEGHGLNTTALCRLVSSRNVKLVITTDTGITNFTEVSLLKGLGVDTVITDHHSLPENLPPAIANINPQCYERLHGHMDHPLAPLCGVGVAFKFCELLLEDKGADPAFTETLLDLVAIGTVADMVPLHRENRYLVYRGLQVLNKRERIGVREILENAGVAPETKLVSDSIGFTIGPRLNAIGRLEKADDAVTLLTTDHREKARTIATHIEQLNRRRQELCDQTLLEAEQFLNAHGGLGDQKTIILASPDWNPGIIGIVATRLKDKYNVPVFMMVVDEAADEVRCSARSIPGFHLHQELTSLSDYFLHFGGHAGAGGFALKREKLDAFKADLYQLASHKITEAQMQPIVEVDAPIQWSQLNPHLVDMISQLAPFGMGNPAPLFVLENAKIAAQRSIGQDGRHRKIILTPPDKPNAPIDGLIWNFGTDNHLNAHHLHRFVVSPELNTFKKVTKVQVIIQDYQDETQGKTTTTVQQLQDKTQLAKASNTASPASPVSEKNEDGNPEFHLIDHRSRENRESFIGQLMLPMQDNPDVGFYNEGTAPQIPFLNESILFNRLDEKPFKDLILWDLPPEMSVLAEILKTVEPKTLHLVGGKYESQPINPAPRDVLKTLYQKLYEPSQPVKELHPAWVAVSLGLTESCVLSGLTLLQKMSLLTVEPTQDNLYQIKIRPKQTGSPKQDLQQFIEFEMFKQTLQPIVQFRQWLLSSPISVIKSQIVLLKEPPGDLDSKPQSPTATSVLSA